MSIRPFSLSATLLAAALSVATIQPVKADDAQTQTAPADAQATQPAQTDAPREGDPRQGGPRRGGGEGGPREGGPRREGGGRGGAGGGRRGEIDPNETPEQREARRERSIEWYVHVIPNLTDAQKEHLMVIVESYSNDLRAVRGATDLTPERRRENSAKVYDQIPARISAALSVEQGEIYDDIIAQQKQNAKDTADIGSARPGEALEELRARVLVGYEPFMEELSVKQKTQIIKALEAAGEESAAVNADTKLSANQKKQALTKIHEGVSAKVTPLLDADQKKSWEKIHATKKP